MTLGELEQLRDLMAAVRQLSRGAAHVSLEVSPDLRILINKALDEEAPPASVRVAFGRLQALLDKLDTFVEVAIALLETEGPPA